MTIIQGLIFSLIQGVTEFLPISSKGHLNLAQALIGLTPSLTLDIFLNTATLFSILFFFRSQTKFFIKNIRYLVVSTVPAVVATLALKEHIAPIFANPQLLSIFFLVTASLLMSTKFIKYRDLEMDFKKALFIGIVQAFAILPGISRSGSTIVAGLFAGLSPINAFTYSFSMSVVASIGALVFDIKELLKIDWANPSYYIAFFATFLVGLISIDALKRLLITRKLWILSFYMAFISIVTFFLLRK